MKEIKKYTKKMVIGSVADKTKLPLRKCAHKLSDS